MQILRTRRQILRKYNLVSLKTITMKRIILVAGIVTAIIVLLVLDTHAQTNSSTNSMKLNAGIVTHKIEETKAFYTNVLHFGVTFENEFYLLLHSPSQQDEISFLLPNHSSQQPIFQSAYAGKGMYLTLQVDQVDEVYKEIKSRGVAIEIELRDEPWGDRHFAIRDPNGIGIDIVTYSAPEK